MQTYRQYQPTGFDPKGLSLQDRQDWLVAPVSINRDTEDYSLTASNWHSALKGLGGESDNVEVHRFGHWACGWFEIILVKPGTPEAGLAEEIESSLSEYPVLDDEDFSEREWQGMCDVWDRASIRDRAAYILRMRGKAQYIKELRGVSIFAARRDVLPEDESGSLRDVLLGK